MSTLRAVAQRAVQRGWLRARVSTVHDANDYGVTFAGQTAEVRARSLSGSGHAVDEQVVVKRVQPDWRCAPLWLIIDSAGRQEATGTRNINGPAWALYHADAGRTRGTSYATLPASRAIDGGWSMAAGLRYCAASLNGSNVIAVGGSAIGGVKLLDIAGESVLWTWTDYTAPTDIAIYDGHVYACSTATRVDKIDLATGSTVWSNTSTGSAIYPPVFDADRMYCVGTLASKVIKAYSLTDGSLSWTYTLPAGTDWSSGDATVNERSLLLISGVLVGRRRATSGVGHTTVFGLDPADGSLLWATQVTRSTVSGYATTSAQSPGACFLGVNGLAISDAYTESGVGGAFNDPADPPYNVSQLVAVNATTGIEAWATTNVNYWIDRPSATYHTETFWAPATVIPDGVLILPPYNASQMDTGGTYSAVTRAVNTATGAWVWTEEEIVGPSGGTYYVPTKIQVLAGADGALWIASRWTGAANEIQTRTYNAGGPAGAWSTLTGYAQNAGSRVEAIAVGSAVYYLDSSNNLKRIT